MPRKKSPKPQSSFLAPFEKVAQALNPQKTLQQRLAVADDVAKTQLDSKQRQKISPYFAVPGITVERLFVAQSAVKLAAKRLKSLDYIATQEDKNYQVIAEFLTHDGYAENQIQEFLSTESGINRLISRKWTEYHKSSPDQQDLIKAQIAALRALINWRDLLNTTEQNGSSFHPAKFYLHRALKESMLNPKAKSSGNALGLMQLTTWATAGIKKHFNLDYGRDDIYYDGQDTEKQIAISTNNVEGGMLYWYLCEHKYVRKYTKLKSRLDINRAAAFAYNIGPEAFRRLWQTLSKRSRLKNYRDFERRLSHLLVKKVPAAKSNPKGSIESKGYNLSFRSRFKIERGKKSPIPKRITIGNHKYETWQLIDALHYARIIDEISANRFHSKPLITTAQK